ENLGDVWMVHHGQRLPLGFETRDDAFGVHSQLDDLERHPPAHRLFLFGHVNHATTAFADLLKNFVAADFVAGLFARRNRQGDGFVWRWSGWLFEKITRVLVGIEQTFNAFAQWFIDAASLLEI